MKVRVFEFSSINMVSVYLTATLKSTWPFTPRLPRLVILLCFLFLYNNPGFSLSCL